MAEDAEDKNSLQCGMTTLEETQKGHGKKVPFVNSTTYKIEQFV